MKAYDLASEVAEFIDWYVEKSQVSGLIHARRRSLQRCVTFVDAHVALIRMLYEILPSERAFRYVSSEPISDARAIAAQIVAAVSQRPGMMEEDVEHWKKTRGFRDLLRGAFRLFADGLRQGFDVQRRELARTHLSDQIRIEFLTIENDRLKRLIDNGPANVKWATVMSTVQRVLCVADGLHRVPESQRCARLRVIMEEATNGSLPLCDELETIVMRHTIEYVLN